MPVITTRFSGSFSLVGAETVVDEAEIKGVLLGLNGFTLVNWIACKVTGGEGKM